MQSLSNFNCFTDLYLWKKDVNLHFSDITDACAQLFGFQDREHALGKSDYDIPSALSKFADVFRENDKRVLQQKKKITFLEIQPCAQDQWKVFHVVKQPYYENNEITGIAGYCIDITKTYMKLDQFITGTKKRTLHQSSKILQPLCVENQLTLRESECLFFLLRRCTAIEIANILHLSCRTVEHHIEILKNKFNASNKKNLIETATHMGYFNLIPESILQKQVSIVVD